MPYSQCAITPVCNYWRGYCLPSPQILRTSQYTSQYSWNTIMKYYRELMHQLSRRHAVVEVGRLDDGLGLMGEQVHGRASPSMRTSYRNIPDPMDFAVWWLTIKQTIKQTSSPISNDTVKKSFKFRMYLWAYLSLVCKTSLFKPCTCTSKYNTTVIYTSIESACPAHAHFSHS